MTYKRFLRNLDQRGVFRIHPGLNRIKRVLQVLGNPQDRVPAIHIAGTNGKGSVAAALESVLRASGFTTGLYSSPHLIDLQERIQINGAPSKSLFIKAADEVLLAEKKARVALTYFELLTAIAFQVFHTAKIDVAILECGLGGKWDATNVIRYPLLSIITTIGEDHMEYLGPSLSQIARQKAGIIKRGRPVISGVLRAGRVEIARAAKARHAPLLQLNRDFSVSTLPTIAHIPFQTIRYLKKGDVTELVPFALLGPHQARNAALAITAVHELVRQGWKVPLHARNSGFRRLSWFGRFQVLERDNLTSLLIDGAHNPPAMKALLDAIGSSNLKHKPKTFLFSCYKDKDYSQMAKQISRVADEVCLCPLGGERAASVTDLRSAFKGVKGPVRVFKSFEHALVGALRDTPSDGLLVITGSLVLVGHTLNSLRLRPSLRSLHV